MYTSDFDPDYNPLIADEDAGFAPRWERAALNGHAAAGLHVPELKPGGSGGGGHGGGGGGSGGGGASVPATNLSTTVAGPSFADSVATTQNKSYTIPPDSSSAVSAGAVLVAANAEIELFTRSGPSNNALTQAFDTRLDAIFAQSGNTTFSGNAFDPRVLYDPNTHRFIVIAIDQGTGPNHTQLLVAVSGDDRISPIQSIADFTPATIDVSNAIPGSWADFPQVGLDNAGHVYVTTNMFSFASGSYTGTRMWVIAENTPGSASSMASHDANGAATDLFSMAPSLMNVAPQSSGDSGDYLVSYNSATNGTDNVLNVVHVTSAGTVDRSFQVDLGSHFDADKLYGGLTAPQPGVSQSIDADDSRTAQAVYQNGHLYVAASTLPASGPDAGHTTVHWWEINTASGQVIQQGTVSGEAAHPGSGLRSYYASLAVSPDEHTLAISFTGSGPTSGTDTAGHVYTGNPSAYVMEVDLTSGLAIPQTDPNTHLAIGSWALVESGKDNYYRTFGGADNRWGDYSSISADPSNPGHFWAFNEYADVHGTVLLGYPNQNGQWATELGFI